MPTSLFILSTPSQAFFLSHVPELVVDSVLVITVKKKKEIQPILKYAKNLDWNQIIIWNLSERTSSQFLGLLHVRIKLWLFKRRFRSFKKVYIGSYVNLIHLSVLAEYEKNSASFLLYDGLQMISVNYSRNHDPKGSLRDYPKQYKSLQFKKPHIRSLTYISPIPLEVSGNDSIKMIKNKVVSRKKTYEKDSIYFIGQPLPGLGLITEDFYIAQLKKMSNHYKEYSIVYFPHPRENEEMLAKIREFLEIRKLDLLFEEYFLQAEKFSLNVFSFYSTVLVNLLFFNAKSNIKAFSIPEENILVPRYREALIPIYNHFRRSGNENFEVLDLKNL